jgi:hypothetical protein
MSIPGRGPDRHTHRPVSRKMTAGSRQPTPTSLITASTPSGPFSNAQAPHCRPSRPTVFVPVRPFPKRHERRYGTKLTINSPGTGKSGARRARKNRPAAADRSALARREGSQWCTRAGPDAPLAVFWKSQRYVLHNHSGATVRLGGSVLVDLGDDEQAGAEAAKVFLEVQSLVVIGCVRDSDLVVVDHAHALEENLLDPALKEAIPDFVTHNTFVPHYCILGCRCGKQTPRPFHPTSFRRAALFSNLSTSNLRLLR